MKLAALQKRVAALEADVPPKEFYAIYLPESCLGVGHLRGREIEEHFRAVRHIPPGIWVGRGPVLGFAFRARRFCQEHCAPSEVEAQTQRLIEQAQSFWPDCSLTPAELAEAREQLFQTP